MKKNSVFIPVAVLVYWGIWGWLSFPYTPFSTDDLMILQRMSQEHYPVFRAWVNFFIGAEAFFDLPEYSGLLLQALAANGLCLGLLLWLSLRLVGSVSNLILVAALYSVSTWPAAYLFHASAAPLCALLCLIAICLIFEAYVNDRAAKFLLILSGVVASMQLMTSLFLAPFVILQLLMVFLLFSSWQETHRWRAFVLHLLPLAVGIGIFVVFWGEPLFAYLKASWAAAQFSGALSTHGDLPAFPMAAFYFMGNFYGPALFYGTLAIALLFILFFIDLKRHRTTREKALFLLCAVIVLHPFMIDLSPVPPPASAHFPVYPLFVLLFVALSQFWVKKVERGKLALSCVAASLLGWTAYVNVVHDQEMVFVKQAGAQAMRSFEEKKIFALHTDIHADILQKWLQIPLEKVESLEEVNAQNGDALLIGPHGQGSGLSLFSYVPLKDFELPFSKPEDMEKLVVPFYGYFPAFVFEVPSTASLYFAGQLPNYREPSLQVELWYFDRG